MLKVYNELCFNKGFFRYIKPKLRHHVMEFTVFFLNSTEIAVTTKYRTFLMENPVAGNQWRSQIGGPNVLEISCITH